MSRVKYSLLVFFAATFSHQAREYKSESFRVIKQRKFSNLLCHHINNWNGSQRLELKRITLLNTAIDLIRAAGKLPTPHSKILHICLFIHIFSYVIFFLLECFFFLGKLKCPIIKLLNVPTLTALEHTLFRLVPNHSYFQESLLRVTPKNVTAGAPGVLQLKWGSVGALWLVFACGPHSSLICPCFF